ncbi:unnamed protein product [Vitrella brassicaformis CCMP3155]|uniref:Uncharacterized protein n=1 Tax=Vitrella brassicaformis (strain CCMP3155) TaxID=1169540 RepID=A0A0G4FIE7_VITBC|nr:unnamed protein product [Vitrella brassicaformis CCMP3155]|eukprot:CEM13216.1 unnamed protein product [Vitrella brassicaformis CCMP3155]
MRLAERLRAREAQFVLGGREVKYLPDFGAEYLRCHGYGHLADLQQALDTIWGREDMQGVQKTIQLLFYYPTISHTVGDHTRPLHTLLAWARKLGVSVECRLKRHPLHKDDEPSMRVDCSEEVSSASPAVADLVADVVQQLAPQATKVDLRCGGTPLHESWKSLPTFPNAKTLYIDAPQKLLANSISPFVLEIDQKDGNDKRFPAVEHLDIGLRRLSLGPNTDTLLASLGDPTSPLTTLLGSLRRVRSVTFRSSFSLAAVAQCVACLRVDKLDEALGVECFRQV